MFDNENESYPMNIILFNMNINMYIMYVGGCSLYEGFQEEQTRNKELLEHSSNEEGQVDGEFHSKLNSSIAT